jgi:hypothetical protein
VVDEQTNPELFNERFAPLLSGFQLGALKETDVPAALDQREESAVDGTLLPLLRGEWGTFNDIRVMRYFGTGTAGKMQATLKTREGDPLIAMAQLGKGRVCIQTHSWSLTDTNFATSRPFVSTVHGIIDRLTLSEAEESVRPDQMRVGDVYQMALPAFRGLGGEVVMQGPRPQPFAISSEDSHVTVRDMYTAGAFRATHSAKPFARERWLAVNRDPNESSPVFATAEQLGGLCGGETLVVTTDELDGMLKSRRELYPLMLVVLIVALLAESLMSVLFCWRRKEKNESAV